ncbi:iron-containing alcohol dehydrogenase family protein [Xylophilus sp. GW821-FHT01B05]
MTETTSPTAFQYVAAELRLHCGPDSLDALARELQRHGCRRAVVVTGRSVGNSEAMQSLRGALDRTLVGESADVRPNSPVSSVDKVARLLAECEADAVIAIGGGSAAVTARAASILLAEGKTAQALSTRRHPDGRFESPRLAAPKIAQFVVPTTPSTAFVKAGSAVHDDATSQRLALFDPKTRAKALFLHPAFLRTAPDALVRSAALNTLSTAIEALESPRCDPLSESMLVHALRLVAQHLNALSPDHEAARQALVVAGVLCGRGTEAAGGGLASVLAHAIGHRAHAANGIVNAIVLPHTMRFNAPATATTSQRILGALAPHTTVQKAHTGQAVAALQDLLAGARIPRQLREIGVQESDLGPIAHAAMADWFIGRSARRVADADEVLKILRAAL